jgi:hypothetical protein
MKLKRSVRKQLKTERVVEYYQLTYLLVVIKSNNTLAIIKTFSTNIAT